MAVRQRVFLFLPGTSPARGPFALDLLRLAAPLVAAGLEVEAADQRLDTDWQRRLATGLKVDGGGPLCFAVPVTAPHQIQDALKACRLVRALRPDVPLVWLGAHPTRHPAQTLAHPLVDYILAGDEAAFADFTSRLQTRTRPHLTPGVGSKDREGHIHLEPLAPPQQLDLLPRLPYEILDVPVSFAKRLRGRKEVALTVCRAGDRLSPRRTLSEILRLDSHGLASLHLDDHHALADHHWARELCSELLRHGPLATPLSATCSVRFLLDSGSEFLHRLWRSGFRALHLPTAAGSDRILRLLNADFTSLDLRNAASLCQKSNLTPHLTFTAGVPTESAQDVHSTLKLMLDIVETHPTARTGTLQLFRPTPNTPLWDLCARNGMREPRTLEDWISFSPNTWYAPGERRRLQLAASLSSFIEAKPPNCGHRWLNGLYTRIVRARIRRSSYGFMPEMHALRYLKASGAL